MESLTKVSAVVHSDGGSSAPSSHPPATSEADRLALALAVAAPGSDAMLIDADNCCAGWAPVPEAAASGRPYCVVPDAGLLVIDGDQADAADRLAPIAAAIRSRGVEPVLVASGREGHRHLLARLPRGDRRELGARARAAGLDVRTGKGGRIRPPLSPHRLGLPVALVSPAAPAEAAAALAPRAAVVATAPARQLSPRMYRLLVDGDVDGNYSTRSELVQAIVTGAVASGWSERRILAVLTNPANRGAAKVVNLAQRKGERTAQRYVRLAVRNARAWLASRPAARAVDVDHQADALEAEADDETWPRQSGGSERRCLDALLDVARRVGSLEFSLSDRDGAELAGITRPTWARAMRRLAAKGWVTRLVVGWGIEASTWRLREPRAGCYHLPSRPPAPPGCEASGNNLRAHHDAWRFRGLGASGWQVYRALNDGRAQSVADVVTSTGLHRQTVRRRLAALVGAGLADESVDGRYLRKWRDLDDVAVELGPLVAGVGARQRERHELEREWYRRHLAHEGLLVVAWRRWRKVRGFPAGVDPDTGEIGSIETRRAA